MEYAQDNLVKISVEPGDYDGSQKCHHIARHRLEFGLKYKEMIMCLCFVPKSGVNIHFVNRTHIETYIDNTLGYLTNRNIYFLIYRYFLNKETLNMDMNKLLRGSKTEWIDKLFTKKEQKKWGITTEHI